MVCIVKNFPLGVSVGISRYGGMEIRSENAITIIYEDHTILSDRMIIVGSYKIKLCWYEDPIILV